MMLFNEIGGPDEMKTSTGKSKCYELTQAKSCPIRPFSVAA